LAAIAGRQDFVALVPQDLGIKLQEGQIVIHEEDAGPALCDWVRRGWAARSVFL
jgi:hypothetical protein